MLYGVLLFLGLFLVTVMVLIFATNLIAQVEFSAILTTIANSFVAVIGYGAMLWLPLGLLAGSRWTRNGFKKALRFSLIANLVIIAAFLILVGTCWGIGSTF